MTLQDRIDKLSKDLTDYRELYRLTQTHITRQKDLIKTLDQRIYILECEVEGLDPSNGLMSINNPLISTIYTPTSLFGKSCPNRIFNDVKNMTIKEFMEANLYSLKGIGRKRYEHAVTTIINDKLYDRRKADVL